MKKTISSAQARVLLVVAMALAGMGQAFAQSATTPEAGIGTGLTTILAIIAVGGAGLITLSLAKVGWTVGAKWISRIGGRG